MAITNGYATLADLKAALSIDTSDTHDDARMEAVIQGVSRAIDKYCRRRFFTTANDETRYFTPLTPWSCWTDDIISITTLATDDGGNRSYSTTWASTDYEKLPINAALNGEPYTGITATPNGSKRFYPHIPNGVKIIGKFGYAASAPDVVREACIIQSMRIFKRKDAPFGIAGAAGMGQLMVVPEIDPDVKGFLAPPIRRLHAG